MAAASNYLAANSHIYDRSISFTLQHKFEFE